jgi:hypothetical protein
MIEATDIVYVNFTRNPQRSYILRKGETIDQLVVRADTNDCEYYKIVSSLEADVAVFTDAVSFPHGKITINVTVQL